MLLKDGISPISFRITVLKSCKTCKDIFLKFTQYKVHILFASIKGTVVHEINVKFTIAQKKDSTCINQNAKDPKLVFEEHPLVN